MRSLSFYEDHHSLAGVRDETRVVLKGLAVRKWSAMRLGDSHPDHAFDGLALVYRKRFNELYRFRWKHGGRLSPVVF